MKIRLMGTRADINTVLPVLTAVLTVQEVSDFHPNRGTSVLGRVYLDVAGPAPNVVRVEAVRTDHAHPTREAIDPTRRGEAR
ncbi:DUF1942 domain-containing protein [Actinophytocola sp.]|uniref:DUF1942 domain-containing protein n=1 Tax=Actinophytocola sp. TaxID=1872138 RepID=UPI002D2D21C1|nr:DUF1942 domain-containing protein [Actinophytocola sp.]HYQ66160.1 DUF1942 domain-containing protein [Actinophytocola sp.]